MLTILKRVVRNGLGEKGREVRKGKRKPSGLSGVITFQKEGIANAKVPKQTCICKIIE